MKLIQTVDAEGTVLCHDITQIIKGVTKDAVFRKGHVVTREDIPVLLSVGKDQLYVWEKEDGMLHENDAAEILCDMCKGQNMERSQAKEGKIELTAACDGLLKVDKKYADGQDIGFVGDIKEVDPKVLYDLLEKDFLPIVAPVGLDDDFNTYNINADDAACAIAKAVGADKLVFLTDIEGLYKDINDKSSFISRLTAGQAEELINGGIIGGGMLPKLNNCTSAIRNGVNRVHILDGRVPHCLLLEIFTNEGVGTAIISDDEEV